MYQRTVAFWAEAKKDRDKVSRHAATVRNLAHRDGWVTTEFVEKYMLRAMNKDVFRSRVINNYFPNARDSGFSILELMRRAEQIRWGRFRADVKGFNPAITNADIKQAVADLMTDEDYLNNPNNRMTSKEHHILTDRMQNENPRRWALKGTNPLWGYLNEHRQYFIPPMRGYDQLSPQDIQNNVNDANNAIAYMEDFTRTHPRTAKPPRKPTMAERSAARKADTQKRLGGTE
jgi:hypothetical protein